MEGGEPLEDEAVADFLRLLEAHRRECEEQGKYVEAEIAKNRLDELRGHEEQRKKEALRVRHHAERVGVEQAHELEYQAVCALWDRKLEEYEANAVALQNQLMSKHEAEQAEARNKFQSDPTRRPKFSRELLNLRRIEATLAKSQEYAEANKVKQKADNMELWELQRMQTELAGKWGATEAKLVTHQENEMHALAKRIQAGREMQNKQREQDLRRLLLRFKNLKADLLAQQSVEKQKLEKSLSSAKRLGATGEVVGAVAKERASPRSSRHDAAKAYGSPQVSEGRRSGGNTSKIRSSNNGY